MRQSALFTKTRREAPADEGAKNAQLLIRAGYVHKEMNALGGQELVMTALQDKALWERTDRWDDEKVDSWFKIALKTGGETGLAITHEEPLTSIMTEHVSSYRDLQ